MPIRSQMSLIMEQIEQEHLELFALEFGKIAESHFVYTQWVDKTVENQHAVYEYYLIFPQCFQGLNRYGYQKSGL